MYGAQALHSIKPQSSAQVRHDIMHILLLQHHLTINIFENDSVLSVSLYAHENVSLCASVRLSKKINKKYKEQEKAFRKKLRHTVTFSCLL